MFLGDSLVEFYRGSLPWVNRGICSDHLQWPAINLFERLGPDRLHPDPQVIVSLVGINDLNDAPDAVDKHVAAYGVLLGTLARLYPDARLVVCSLLPTEGPYVRLGPRIVEFNRGLSDLADATGAGFLNLYDQFIDPASGAVRRGLLVADGLHISRRGYATLTAMVEDRALMIGITEGSGPAGPILFRRSAVRAALSRAWRRLAGG